MLTAPGAGVQGPGGLRGRQPRGAHRQQPWVQHQCSQAVWEVAPGTLEVRVQGWESGASPKGRCRQRGLSGAFSGRMGGEGP